MGLAFQRYTLFERKCAIDDETEAVSGVLGLRPKDARVRAWTYYAAWVKVTRLRAIRANCREPAVAWATARALAKKLRPLLGDGPTTALEPEMVPEVLNDRPDLVADGVTMTVLTHDVGAAPEVAHRIVVMERDVVVEESWSNQFSTKENRQEHPLQLQESAVICPRPDAPRYGGFVERRKERHGSRW